MRAASTGVELRPGDLIEGKYRVERLLGRGGMGAVFAARHEQLARRVALKLPARSRSPAAVARFLREARALAAIESDHVARVLDAGERAPGEPYLVMELLAGEDLDTTLRERGSLEQREAVRCVLEAGLGLAAAHARGIVHRDLKPANLFLARRTDGTSIVKILDFGIAKLRSEEDVSLTATDQVLGSPRYMAPEQIEGSPEVDERADLWALGAVLHELLCGTPAFEGRSFAELRAQIAASPPRSLRLGRPEIPADLEAVILRCLQKAPDRRFLDVAELLEALVPFGPEDAARCAARARAELSRRADIDGQPLSGATTEPDSPPELDTTPTAGAEAKAAPTGGSGGSEGPPAAGAAAGPTETSPPVSRTGSIRSHSRPEVPGGASSSGRRWLAVGVCLLLSAVALAAAVRWWPAARGEPPPEGVATSEQGLSAEEDAELAAARRRKDSGDRAGATRAFQAIIDSALVEGVAPGSPRAAVAGLAALALADMAAEDLAPPPPPPSLERYLEPVDTLARQTQEGMRLYGAVIPWQNTGAIQCALVGQARLHERQADLLLALSPPPPRTGPHERGAWSPEAALEQYRMGASSALGIALDLHENAAARPVSAGGCREEATRGRARLRARLPAITPSHPGP